MNTARRKSKSLGGRVLMFLLSMMSTRIGPLGQCNTGIILLGLLRSTAGSGTSESGNCPRFLKGEAESELQKESEIMDVIKKAFIGCDRVWSAIVCENEDFSADVLLVSLKDTNDSLLNRWRSENHITNGEYKKHLEDREIQRLTTLAVEVLSILENTGCLMERHIIKQAETFTMTRLFEKAFS